MLRRTTAGTLVTMYSRLCSDMLSMLHMQRVHVSSTRYKISFWTGPVPTLLDGRCCSNQGMSEKMSRPSHETAPGGQQAAGGSSSSSERTACTM